MTTSDHTAYGVTSTCRDGLEASDCVGSQRFYEGLIGFSFPMMFTLSPRAEGTTNAARASESLWTVQNTAGDGSFGYRAAHSNGGRCQAFPVTFSESVRVPRLGSPPSEGYSCCSA